MSLEFDIRKLIRLRAEKDRFFRTHEQSPLTPAQRKHFSGLSYYIPMPRLHMAVALEVFDDRADTALQTTQGETRWYQRYGRFTFRIGPTDVWLTVYRTPHGFFLPFVDALAGDETYPAGRYLEPVALEDDRLLVDFNQAYNPYCAYNTAYDCPITPAENRIDVPIRAGEKLPQGEWLGLAKPHDEA